MNNGPIIGAGASRTFIHRSGVKRFGVPFFYLSVSVLAAYFSATAFAQISVEPLTGSSTATVPTPNGDNILAAGYIPQANQFLAPSSPTAPTEGPSPQSAGVQLSPEEVAIGLMPAAQFFTERTVTSSVPAPDTQALLNQQISLNVPQSKVQTQAYTRPETNFFEDIWSGVTRTFAGGAQRSRQIIGDKADETFAGFVGVGAAMAPVYAGADEYHFIAKPVGHVEIARFIRLSHQEGAELVPFRDLPVELAVGMNVRKNRSKDARPVGLEPYDYTLEVGGEVSASIEGVELFVDVEKGMLGDNLGWEVETGIRSKYIQLDDQIDVSAQLSATWVDQDYMTREFGVSSAEATATGLSAYAPEAGLRDVTLSLEAFYYLTENFGLYAGVDAEVLLENAMRSPIVDKEGNLLQLTSNLGLIYRF